MFTRRGIDLPSGPDPFMGPATSIDGRLERLEASLAHERQERRRLLESIAAWLDWLNGEGALDISDAAIEGTPIGADTPDTGAFTTLTVSTSSTFPTSSTTPTVTAGGGSFTTVSGAVRSVKIGDRRFYTATVTITTNGTANTYVQVPMPDAAAETTASAGVDAVAFTALTGYVTGANLLIYKYDGTYPGADGKTLVMSGSYRV